MNGTGFYLQVMKSMKTAVWQKQLHTAAGSGWILTICGIRDTPEKAGWFAAVWKKGLTGKGRKNCCGSLEELYLQQKERLENYKIESEKIKKYNSENLFKKEKGQETEKVVQEENNKLIVKRDLSFKKILAKLKSIFRFIKGL